MSMPDINVPRRLLLGSTAAAAAGGLLTGFGAGGLRSAVAAAPAQEAPGGPGFRSFYGQYQSGIIDAQQEHAVFAGWDVLWRDGSRKQQLQALLQMLTDDSARLMGGRGVLADTEPEMAQPPSELTLTVGLGQSLLDVAGCGSIAQLPDFAGDELEEQYQQSDLLIQFCSQDPTVLHHAVRAVAKNLRGLARQRFAQAGFMRPMPGRETFRNLFGQVDGVNNPKDQLREQAVFGDGQDSWIANGTTLALRRFEMDLDRWDEVDATGRDFALGRRQADGSPLSGTSVDDPVDLAAVNDLGLPSIAANAHVALAKPSHAAESIHRRGYNYDDGQHAGLLFASYQRDPSTSFIPVQQRLAAADALNTWLKPVGSALYAILPGISEGGYLGEQLFS
ncbi:Dyp-type peroxidase [Glutamicibacter sp. FBE19]|uniref:Dyp-type peroxidase n=1 Tax=Glutamicibacter sp. FBE19 TaxID=2761534 RepID=UPI0018966B3A|nr:Dyp-type peroxidase [Glutamicibacter sp. FBE19]MBF6672957.1 Dyp-type peroxidase [Glutamicibacter sp. FBE19]